MALRQLLTGLQRLSLQAAASQVSHKAAATSLQCSRIANDTVPRSCLHSSSACLRRLDSRLTPIFKEPSKRTDRWVEPVQYYKDYDYTVRPLPMPRSGGRGPNGRIWNHKRGGGAKRRYRMIDWVRANTNETSDRMEKVDEILYDPNRSARIALVASGEKKRYIIATQNMKSGDIIRSSRTLSKTAVRPSEGDSYPVGSLPIGTLVSCLERFPDDGARFARSAGVTAQLVRKTGDQCVLRLPSKREVCVSSKCAATVGRVSNVDHNKRVIGKAGRNRWLGIRPSSGRWHRKTGRFGRKIRPTRPMKVYSSPTKPQPQVYRMTF